jgi:hypothetical protein
LLSGELLINSSFTYSQPKEIKMNIELIVEEMEEVVAPGVALGD